MAHDNQVKPGRFDTRFWKADLKAAFILSFMSISFGIGIADISNFPLQAGLVSAVVALLVIGIMGGSYIVVCGSAAALAPILAGSVAELGGGNEMLGYQRTLAVIICTGPLMYLVGKKRYAGYFASLFSHSVTSGLLAAIAIILLTSRFSTFTGIKFDEKTLFGVFGEAFGDGRIFEANQTVLMVSLASFLFLAVLTLLKGRFKFLEAYPPQLWAIPFLFLVAALVPMEQKYLINIPADLTSFHMWPDFNFAAMSRDGVLAAFVQVVLTLAIVDTAESVATVLGIDRLDKYKRTSDVNKVVSAMGVANFISGFLGGMSNIPGGAKSTMSAAVGTVTVWCSIFSAGFVVLLVLIGREYMNLLPQAGLAAIIVFTVMKMCWPTVWIHFWKTGRDQFAVFFTTFAVSIWTGDILEGLIAGVVVQLLSVVVLAAMAVRLNNFEDGVMKRFFATCQVVFEMLFSTVAEVVCDREQNVCDVYLKGAHTFMHRLDRTLEQIPLDASVVRFHIGDGIYLVDHPTMEKLHQFIDSRGVGELFVCESLTAVSDHHTATRFRLPRVGDSLAA